jgi:hypothetical protein
MGARSQAARTAALPLPEEQLVNGLAQALYERHSVERTPEWHAASEAAREWMRESARAALAHLRALRRPWR